MDETQEKRSAPKRKRILLAAAAACLAAVVVAAVFLTAQKQENDVPSTEPETTGPEITEHGMDQTTGYELETPIGVLCYPQEWTEYVEVVKKTEGNTFVADFYSKLPAQNVHIFSLFIGEEGKGFQMGSLNDQSVWVNVVTGAENPEWTEAEADQISNMRSRVNDLMDQIYNLDGFVKSQPKL